MKTRSLLTVALVSSFLCSTISLQAREFGAYDDFSPDATAIDALIARPLLLVSTAIGTGIFVASLPISVATGSTRQTAKSLIGTPGKLTFKRKLGKLSKIEDK